MPQPTDYALGLLFAAWLDLAGWGLVIYGAGMVVGGVIAIVYLIATWGGVTLGPDPVIPPVAAPDTVVLPRPPKSHAAREDDDTHVIVARIPGATPELTPQLAAVARYLDDVEAVTEATTAVHHELGVTAWETFERVEGLRVIPSSGPTCPTCGGPFGACACYGQKSAPKPDPLDVTQDIVVPFAEPPIAEAVAEHRNRQRETQELSAHMAKIQDRERVA